MDLFESILGLCLIVLPFICVVIPGFLKNWKRLIIWHLCFSILASSLLLSSEFGLALHGGNPAGAGGAVMYIIVLVTLHLIACAIKVGDLTLFSAPRKARPIGVRAVDTMTASVMKFS